jgi:hypothetical protein
MRAVGVYAGAARTDAIDDAGEHGVDGAQVGDCLLQGEWHGAGS